MSKTVLISLAAVVALIVIVVLLGMRYLRTDDEEDFDEETATEGVRSGARSGPPVRDHDVRVRSHHHGREDERPGSGSGRAATARRPDGPELRGGAGAEQDGRWHEDSGEMRRLARPPQRDQHLVTSGRTPRRHHADVSDAAGAHARQVAGRGPSRSGEASRDGRATRDGWDASERGATRPNARADALANRAKPDSESLPAVKPRAGRTRRESEGDWPTTDWDELSDVDYWAELAADKPLTAATPAADAARPARREPRQEPRRRQQPQLGRDLRDSGRRDGDADGELPAKHVRRQERQPQADMVPAPSRAAEARAMTPRPIEADDDPLTSPSFPRVRAEDSRTYHRMRTAGSDWRQPGSHTGPMPAIGNGYPDPAGYPRTAAVHARPGYAGAASASYQIPASAAGSYPAPAGYGFPADLAGYDGLPTRDAGGYQEPWSPSGALQGHQGSRGYQPANPEPEPGRHAAPYQLPSTPLPGQSDRGDPYAGDPYGLPGYGGSGY